MNPSLGAWLPLPAADTHKPLKLTLTDLKFTMVLMAQLFFLCEKQLG